MITRPLSLQLSMSTTEYNPAFLLCTLWFYCENLHRNWPELCKEARTDHSWDFCYDQTCATKCAQRRGVKRLECIIEVQQDRMRDLKIDVVPKVIQMFTRRWSWTVKPRKDVWNPDVRTLIRLQKLNCRQIDADGSMSRSISYKVRNIESFMFMWHSNSVSVVITSFYQECLIFPNRWRNSRKLL